MATKETNIVQLIRLFAPKFDCVIWKNVRGNFLSHDGKRRIAAGLNAAGASDLIGFTRVKITPEMVGQTIAVFTAIEVKTETGTASIAQKDFIDFVLQNGGKAGLARNVDDAKKIVQ
jgi:hypothetical protein